MPTAYRSSWARDQSGPQLQPEPQLWQHQQLTVPRWELQFCSFQWRSFTYLSLDLFLVFWWFWRSCKWCHLKKFQSVYFWNVEIKLIFFILTEYPVTLLNSLTNSNRYSAHYFGFSILYTLSCHLLIMTVLFFPIQSLELSFIFLDTLGKTFKTMLYRDDIKWESLSVFHSMGKIFNILH